MANNVFNNKTVLVTGSTGLIGKFSIQPLLDAGFKVFAVSFNRQPENKRINWVKADLLNSLCIKDVFEKIKPQYLLHLAWDTTPETYLESNINFDWVISSLEILKQFGLNGGKRAVFAGTCFEYEFKNTPLYEEDKLNPISTYAKCKNLLNQLATLYCEKNNISFGWGRIFYVFGEGENEKRLVPYVINSLKNNEEVVIKSGEFIKDYMYASDIAEAFAKFLNTNVQGNVNICNGEPVKIKEIVNLIAKKINKQHLIKFKDANTNEAKIILGENKRLIYEIGFVPKYSLESALDKLIGEYTFI